MIYNTTYRDKNVLQQIDEKVGKIAKGLCKNSQRAIKESKFLIQHAIYTNPEGFRQEEIKFKEKKLFPCNSS